MAGMFYSIQETAAKLHITEDEVKQLAREGKLREFRDGESIMFKVEEVDNRDDRESALRFDVLDEAPAESADVPPAADAPAAADEIESDLDDSLTIPEESLDAAEASADDLDALLAFTDDDDDVTPEEDSAEVTPTTEPVAEEISALDDELDLLSLDEAPVTEDEPQIDLLSDTQVADDAPAPVAADESASDLDEILLSDTSEPAPEPTSEPDLDTLGGLDDDTAITGEGVNVLGETDGDYKLTDDTMAETLAGLGATGEASIEEIEEDVNLDSFGSGSGLLDLSLQADDTSLGGILDEIYTSDDDEAPSPDTEHATTEGMTADMDELPAADDMVEPEIAMAPIRSGSMVAELEPDASSNTLGALLFVPLLLAIYTAIVSLYATVTEGQLVAAAEAIKRFIWIIMGGLFVVALVWAIVGFAKGSAGSAKPKAKKAKKSKAEKPKKAKKEKKPKEKKAKKGLFGKKK